MNTAERERLHEDVFQTTVHGVWNGQYVWDDFDYMYEREKASGRFPMTAQIATALMMPCILKNCANLRLDERSDADREDAVMSCYLELAKALERYDPATAKFPAYAEVVIHGAVAYLARGSITSYQANAGYTTATVPIGIAIDMDEEYYKRGTKNYTLLNEVSTYAALPAEAVAETGLEAKRNAVWMLYFSTIVNPDPRSYPYARAGDKRLTEVLKTTGYSREDFSEESMKPRQGDYQYGQFSMFLQKVTPGRRDALPFYSQASSPQRFKGLANAERIHEFVRDSMFWPEETLDMVLSTHGISPDDLENYKGYDINMLMNQFVFNGKSEREQKDLAKAVLDTSVYRETHNLSRSDIRKVTGNGRTSDKSIFYSREAMDAAVFWTGLFPDGKTELKNVDGAVEFLAMHNYPPQVFLKFCEKNGVELTSRQRDVLLNAGEHYGNPGQFFTEEVENKIEQSTIEIRKLLKQQKGAKYHMIDETKVHPVEAPDIPKREPLSMDAGLAELKKRDRELARDEKELVKTLENIDGVMTSLTESVSAVKLQLAQIQKERGSIGRILAGSAIPITDMAVEESNGEENDEIEFE
jgi:hypothetical protein